MDAKISKKDLELIEHLIDQEINYWQKKDDDDQVAKYADLATKLHFIYVLQQKGTSIC